RARCSSENQKKSAIAIPPRRRQVNHISLALGIPLMGPDPRLMGVRIAYVLLVAILLIALCLIQFWYTGNAARALRNPLPEAKLKGRGAHLARTCPSPSRSGCKT